MLLKISILKDYFAKIYLCRLTMKQKWSLPGCGVLHLRRDTIHVTGAGGSTSVVEIFGENFRDWNEQFLDEYLWLSLPSPNYVCQESGHSGKEVSERVKEVPDVECRPVSICVSSSSTSFVCSSCTTSSRRRFRRWHHLENLNDLFLLRTWFKSHARRKFKILQSCSVFNPARDHTENKSGPESPRTLVMIPTSPWVSESQLGINWTKDLLLHSGEVWWNGLRQMFCIHRWRKVDMCRPLKA